MHVSTSQVKRNKSMQKCNAVQRDRRREHKVETTIQATVPLAAAMIASAALGCTQGLKLCATSFSNFCMLKHATFIVICSLQISAVDACEKSLQFQ